MRWETRFNGCSPISVNINLLSFEAAKLRSCGAVAFLAMSSPGPSVQKKRRQFSLKEKVDICRKRDIALSTVATILKDWEKIALLLKKRRDSLRSLWAPPVSTQVPDGSVGSGKGMASCGKLHAGKKRRPMPKVRFPGGTSAFRKSVGLDLYEGTVRDNQKAGVLEPTVSKIKSLKFATEAAITILRIDDLIKLEPSPSSHDDRDECM
ncbi:hypothetical protein HPB52_006670 [Rhipicephalus sanguineus]|uniref:Uncharacterized protein n=1 Tax=Rhipicephalus sanguineus TaxID=34632 RepID=A0A9D4PL37_RHISA|nr:hypothetical protein HPB52_006670 [Rhipicephalus sanguineus]